MPLKALQGDFPPKSQRKGASRDRMFLTALNARVREALRHSRIFELPFQQIQSLMTVMHVVVNHLFLFDLKRLKNNRHPS